MHDIGDPSCHPLLLLPVYDQYHGSNYPDSPVIFEEDQEDDFEENCGFQAAILLQSHSNNGHTLGS